MSMSLTLESPNTKPMASEVLMAAIAVVTMTVKRAWHRDNLAIVNCAMPGSICRPPAAARLPPPAPRRLQALTHG